MGGNALKNISVSRINNEYYMMIKNKIKQDMSKYFFIEYLFDLPWHLCKMLG